MKYFNALETTIPSAGNNIQFYVQLFENGLPHSERQLVKYNATQGLDSYFEFIGAESGKDYSLKIYEQPTSNLLGNTWAWNNWGGASSVDALIISYMSVGNPVVSSYPWILPEGASDYTALFSQVADITGDGNILGSDPLALMFRTIGLPGYNPFPGGTHNFQLATTKLAAHAEKAHPAAPEVLFAQNGTYTAASPASSVYYEAELTNLNDGLNVFNVYFVATGDMNTSYVPGTAAKASVNLGFDNIIAANVGDEILIPVVINQAAELGAVSLGLSYNTDLIEVVDVPGYDIVNIDAEAGTVRIAWMDQLGKAYGSGQEILVLKAKVLTDIQAGTAYMSLMSDTELGDRQANVLHDISLSTSYIGTGVTGIGDLSDLKLNHRIFPNPFNDATQIQYTLPVAGKVRVDVYNHLGQLVITLADELQQAGAHKLLLNNYDLNGAGSYFYQISVNAEGQSFTERGTIVLTK